MEQPTVQVLSRPDRMLDTINISSVTQLPPPAAGSSDEADDDSDSESDYSQSQPSRRSSIRPGEEIVDQEQTQAEGVSRESTYSQRGASRPHTAVKSRPESEAFVDAFEEVSLSGEYADTLDSGSKETSEGYETVRLYSEEQPPSQTSISLRAESIHAFDAAHAVTANSLSDPEHLVELDSRTLIISPMPQSPAGSDYCASRPRSPVSPVTPTLPISPMTPEDALTSINSMRPVALAGSDFINHELSAAQNEDVQGTPRASATRHMRKPSSLDMLRSFWRPTLTRQSTFFDNTKDEPLETQANEIIERTEEPGPKGEQYDEEEDFYDDDGDVEYGTAEAMSVGQQRRAPSVLVEDTASAWRSNRTSSLYAPKRDSGSSVDEEDMELELDWNTLDRTEEQEKEDKELPEGVEDESTAFLLARLEQENAKFTADPKSSVSFSEEPMRTRSKVRPPSMAQLKKLVSRRSAPSIRFSMATTTDESLPDEPPPMTELEFWAALVQDYPTTASRLPTLTTTKIRAGIPPPLRGVVWASMAGARDKNLEEAFEKLQHERSPYEGIINKDVGRSFPGVDLFRDAEGEGQQMLGRVLKCFSLHDKDIGYCQGLGFLVGPLLMNMGEKDAFCVLVRLMEHYALRPSFLPSLSGLHMRIFQFSSLLAQHHPELSEHLTNLGVEPAYLSQWFLSCFAVTCPLPMLFRIYDVIFAEGANETVMRVALALFRRNEAKMLASHEFEEVMQLLLGRALWDVYGCSADELVDDFTSLGHIITHARLAELEREFESKDGDAVGQSAGFLPDVQAAASRFLGRLWFPSHGHTPSKGAANVLTPQAAEKESPGGLMRPNFLRRSPSKQSLAQNDSSGSESARSHGSGSGSVTSTAITDNEIHDIAARESQVDSMSLKSKPGSMRTVSISTSAALIPPIPGNHEQQQLHSEIEDMLMALSEMQRENAQIAAMLQREREERNDDHRVVKQLLAKISKGDPGQPKPERRSMPPPARAPKDNDEVTTAVHKRRTLPARPRLHVRTSPAESEAQAKPSDAEDLEISGLVQEVRSRLDTNSRFSASFETKAQLRSTLTRVREQLSTAQTQVKDLNERAEFSETSLKAFQNEGESLRSEVEELRTRVNDDFKERQKLELTIENLRIQMRMEARSVEKKRANVLIRAESSEEIPSLKRSDTRTPSRNNSISSRPGSSGGLRELKLGRRESSGSVASIRSMRSSRHSEWPPSYSAVEISPSPPDSAGNASIEPPPPGPAPERVASVATPSTSLTVPAPSGPSFARRTTSLVAQEVFATSQHEPVPEEALLLELVNAKTAEATARQELDEIRKAMQVAKRRAEESQVELEAQLTSAKLEAERSRRDAEEAWEEARSARAEVFDASEMKTPVTPGITLTESISSRSKEEAVQPDSPYGKATPPVSKKAESSPGGSGGGGGWFWSRRSPSTTKAAVEEK